MLPFRFLESLELNTMLDALLNSATSLECRRFPGLQSCLQVKVRDLRRAPDRLSLRMNCWIFSPLDYQKALQRQQTICVIVSSMCVMLGSVKYICRSTFEFENHTGANDCVATIDVCRIEAKNLSFIFSMNMIYLFV